VQLLLLDQRLRTATFIIIRFSLLTATLIFVVLHMTKTTIFYRFVSPLLQMLTVNDAIFKVFANNRPCIYIATYIFPTLI
jgi:hypothetical protein